MIMKNRFDHPIEAYDSAKRLTQTTDPAIRKIAKRVVKMYEDEISDIIQMTAPINGIKGVQNSISEPNTAVQRIMIGMDIHLNPVIGQSSMASRIHAQLIHVVSIPELLGIQKPTDSAKEPMVDAVRQMLVLQKGAESQIKQILGTIANRPSISDIDAIEMQSLALSRHTRLERRLAKIEANIEDIKRTLDYINTNPEDTMGTEGYEKLKTILTGLERDLDRAYQ